MELIGKTRSVYERDAEPTLTIWPQKGKLNLNRSAIKHTGLFDSAFAVGYDTKEDGTIAIYIYEDDQNGMPLPSTGNITNKYHARRIWDTLTDIEDIDHNTSFELAVSTTIHKDERFPGMDFYELTYAAKEIETQSAVEEEAEVLAAGGVQEVEEVPFYATPDNGDTPAFNLQNAGNPAL